VRARGSPYAIPHELSSMCLHLELAQVRGSWQLRKKVRLVAETLDQHACCSRCAERPICTAISLRYQGVGELEYPLDDRTLTVEKSGHEVRAISS
jgi:hypothetical protein